MKRLQDTPTLFRDPETGMPKVQMEWINVWGYSEVHCFAIPITFKQMDINITWFIRASGRDMFLLEEELRIASIQINENLRTVMFHKVEISHNIFSLLESICQ